MGKGPTTRQKNVKKVPPKGTGTGSGIPKSDDAKEKCLFTVKEKISIVPSLATNISVGRSVVLIANPSSAHDIDVFVDGILVGSYLGVKTRLLRACMKDGFQYKGTVDSIASNGKGFEVSFTVSGA